MPHSSRPTNQEADEAFDEGMEYWWAGNRRRAVIHFRRALELNPDHGEAHNHLGIAALESGKLTAAERHFRAAIADGARDLERVGTEIPWGIIENRAYLRAIANLALALSEQNKWIEVLGIYHLLLSVNPHDNLGVRWMIGLAYLHVGDDAGAIEAYEGCLHEEVGCAFGLALARLRTHEPRSSVGEALLVGFAANRYLAPMLLEEDWEPLDDLHGSGMADPMWATDVSGAQAELWRATPHALETLWFWWTAPPVVKWRQQLDEVKVRLKDLPHSDERQALLDELDTLRSDETMQAVAREVQDLA